MRYSYISHIDAIQDSQRASTLFIESVKWNVIWMSFDNYFMIQVQSVCNKYNMLNEILFINAI